MRIINHLAAIVGCGLCCVYLAGCDPGGDLTEQAREVEPSMEERETGSAAETPEDRLSRANTLASEASYEEAAELYESVLTTSPEDFGALDGFRLATIYAYLGENEKHLSLSKWMFEHFPGESDVQTAELTGKAFVINPRAGDESLSREAQARIRFAVENGKGGLLKWFTLSRGMAAYRSGEFDTAFDWLGKTLDDNNRIVGCLSNQFAALSKFALKEPETARAHIDRANTLIKALTARGGLDREQDWQNLVTIELAGLELIGVEEEIERGPEPIVTQSAQEPTADMPDESTSWIALMPVNLDGWRNSNKWWKIEGDMIVAESPGGKDLPKLHYLIRKKPIENDFELLLEYRIDSDEPQDAGLNFRVEPGPWNKGNLRGYQVELVSGKDFDTGWGKLFGNIHDGKRNRMFQSGKRVEIAENGEEVVTELEPAFDKRASIRHFPEWNSCRLNVIGDHIELYLNDQLANVIIDQDGENKSVGKTIALQFRPSSTYRFEVRNLTYRAIE